jgi:hypothetical protein
MNLRILHGDHIVFMCSVWLSEQTEIFSLQSIKRMDFMTEVESVYSAVRTGYVYIYIYIYNIPFVLRRLNCFDA